jgi:hypothetical protein
MWEAGLNWLGQRKVIGDKTGPLSYVRSSIIDGKRGDFTAQINRHPDAFVLGRIRHLPSHVQDRDSGVGENTPHEMDTPFIKR